MMRPQLRARICGNTVRMVWNGAERLTPRTASQAAAIRVIDATRGVVQRLGTLPRALAHAALVALGGALYLVGGRTTSGAASASILRIDPASGQVRAVARLPLPLADAAAVAVDGRVIVLGGAGTAASAAVYWFRP